MQQFLTDAEGHPFDRKYILVERAPDLRIPACSQICPILSVKLGDCKAAVVPKPYRHIHSSYTHTDLLTLRQTN